MNVKYHCFPVDSPHLHVNIIITVATPLRPSTSASLNARSTASATPTGCPPHSSPAPAPRTARTAMAPSCMAPPRPRSPSTPRCKRSRRYVSCNVMSPSICMCMHWIDASAYPIPSNLSESTNVPNPRTVPLLRRRPPDGQGHGPQGLHPQGREGQPQDHHLRRQARLPPRPAREEACHRRLVRRPRAAPPHAGPQGLHPLQRRQGRRAHHQRHGGGVAARAAPGGAHQLAAHHAQGPVHARAERRHQQPGLQRRAHERGVHDRGARHGERESIDRCFVRCVRVGCLLFLPTFASLYRYVDTPRLNYNHMSTGQGQSEQAEAVKRMPQQVQQGE